MQLQTEKEIHAATSGCRLTIDHWGGESEALFSPSTNSQMWWFSRFWPGLGSFCSSWEGSWPGPGAYPMPPHILASGGGKGASCFPWSLSGSTKFGSTTHKPWRWSWKKIKSGELNYSVLSVSDTCSCLLFFYRIYCIQEFLLRRCRASHILKNQVIF